MGVIATLKNNKVGAVVVSVFDWYPSEYPKEERKLLRKLDLAILVFGSLSCKSHNIYLDLAIYSVLDSHAMKLKLGGVSVS
ncbi:hypothetical protein QWA68_014306 [Fusarium oxysporum]|nr:hypothetical protein QWA68_014306 [Fusarium oxysporum]